MYRLSPGGYKCPSANTKSRKLEDTDAYGEFHTNINDDYSGLKEINI
jgi:hypothetical protein